MAFRFGLPTAPPTRPPAAADEGVAVLVVDPDAETRQLYARTLEREGFRVFAAIDGREAVVQLVKARPAAVILHTSLPYIDGFELCDLIRHDEASAAVRIVAITTNATHAYGLLVRERGADVVL